MEAKTFEIRDRATFIPAFAINPGNGAFNEYDRWLWARAGYGLSPTEQGQYVILGNMNEPTRTRSDPYQWGDRTMHTAHLYILEHWDELASGDVIDVQFILGETATRKTSERGH